MSSSILPIITFKAGICEADTSSKPYKIKPQATPGYIYLYSEDGSYGRYRYLLQIPNKSQT